MNCTLKGLNLNLFILLLTFEEPGRKDLMPEMNLAANFEPTVEKWSFTISAIVLGSEITTPSDSIHEKEKNVCER